MSETDGRAGGAVLAGLGRGGAADRLSARLLLRLLLRCATLLRPVRGHLLGLFAGFGTLALLFLPLGLLLFDALFTRVLEGRALLPVEAAFFRLDPATAVAVEALDEATRRELLGRVIAVGVVATAVAAPAVLALVYYQIWILQRVNQLLRVQLLERLQQLSLRFHHETSVGDALYRMVQDSAMVTQLVDVLFLTPLQTATRFLFSLAVVAAFAPDLALALALLWPPLLLLGAAVSRRLRVGFRRARETQSELTGAIQEMVAGMRVLKAYGAEARARARFETASRRAFDAAFRARGLLAGFLVGVFWIAATGLVVAGALAALHTYAAHEVAVAVAGFGAWNLGLFNYAKTRFGDGVTQSRHLMRVWGRLQDIAIGLDRVFEVLDLEPEVRDAPDAAELREVARGVRFRDVHFRYEPHRPAIEGVSFEARVGEITALVGPTGAGKSTLMALLLRLFDPESGRIEIDGAPLSRFRVESLRARAAVVLQENLLFGTPIRENIRFAVPDASDEAVRAAARVACADEFIEALPEGYDTPLGERGAGLSTGQRQRLSIARAVLKEAPILILDEPTASLDVETEERLLRNLAAWGRGRLVFLITHRLSTARRAHRIVVLREGRVVEEGRPEELATRPGGVYRSLLEAESESGEPPRRAGAGP